MTGPRAPVHLLWGEDAFLLRDAALALIGPEISAREVDASEWQGGETADLATPSLFGDRRGLVVTDARRLPDEALRELERYLAAPAPDAPLVLCAPVLPRGKAPAALAKLVRGVGEVREVKLARKDLVGWLGARAKGKGLQLAPDGALAVVEALGEDPSALDQALEQLAAAFGTARITREVVAEQFRGLGEQHVWDLCDKAFGRDLPGAVRSVRTMLEAREDPLPILGGIASRLRDLLRVKALPERMPPAELARAAGLRFEWQARRYREQARRFTIEELSDLHAHVVEADRALKSGATDDVVLPLLVTAIAGGSRED
ncbi:MAG: DNA polymerase III subunit delta [Candidatus Velamenicoccus archaeovorus]